VRASVLVTDGGQRASLATVRSLGRAGHPVTVASARAPSLAGASRHSADEFEVPDPLLDPDGFAGAMVELVRRRPQDVVLPITEPAILALLPVRERLAPAVVPFPDLEVFRRVCDKSAVFAAAREVGIRVPPEQVLESADPSTWVLPAEDQPVVVKPHRSVVEGEDASGKLSVLHARDLAELDKVLRDLPTYAFPLHLQSRIEGPGIGVFLLIHEGEPILRFAHRRIREKPPAGGVSVYRESTPLDPDLLRLSLDLLDRLDWNGVAMVEFKVDDATGTPYLMEINGRLWGSLQLAIDCGADFPKVLVETALGREAPADEGYRTGTRLRWSWGEVDHLLARLRRSNTDLHLPSYAPGRLAAVGRFLTAPMSSRSEVLRLDDPLPALRETLDWFADLRRGGNR
jgi:predicted ATP-grasp superfamily ATP-dependent carboligase